MRRGKCVMRITIPLISAMLLVISAAPAPAQVPAAVDARTRSRLKSLGYVD